jgi:hypothetical protein
MPLRSWGVRQRPYQVPPSVKADRLLREHLTPDQIREWEAHGYISVRGSRGGKYRLHRVPNGTGRIEARGLFWRWTNAWRCVSTRYGGYAVPDADDVLALKLALENDERWVLRMAPIYRPSVRR